MTLGRVLSGGRRVSVIADITVAGRILSSYSNRCLSSALSSPCYDVDSERQKVNVENKMGM
jgi:hypothetical protein